MMHQKLVLTVSVNIRQTPFIAIGAVTENRTGGAAISTDDKDRDPIQWAIAKHGPVAYKRKLRSVCCVHRFGHRSSYVRHGRMIVSQRIRSQRLELIVTGEFFGEFLPGCRIFKRKGKRQRRNHFQDQMKVRADDYIAFRARPFVILGI